jgi:hypothetical protein
MILKVDLKVVVTIIRTKMEIEIEIENGILGVKRDTLMSLVFF